MMLVTDEMVLAALNAWLTIDIKTFGLTPESNVSDLSEWSNPHSVKVMRAALEAALQVANEGEKMAEVTIYGASDDLVEFEGSITEEFDAYEPWRGTLTSTDGQSLTITAAYGDGWTLGVHATDTYPSWPIRFTERPVREGDPAIIIDVPEGTTITEAK